MQKIITKTEFKNAEMRLENLLSLATSKGGFAFLSESELNDLENFTQIVKKYEDIHFVIETPQTLQDLISLKMYEKKLKQKEMAKILQTTDTKFSEIMRKKRKPSLSFLKSLNKEFEIDGNLLLKLS